MSPSPHFPILPRLHHHCFPFGRGNGQKLHTLDFFFIIPSEKWGGRGEGGCESGPRVGVQADFVAPNREGLPLGTSPWSRTHVNRAKFVYRGGKHTPQDTSHYRSPSTCVNALISPYFYLPVLISLLPLLSWSPALFIPPMACFATPPLHPYWVWCGPTNYPT